MTTISQTHFSKFPKAVKELRKWECDDCGLVLFFLALFEMTDLHTDMKSAFY